MNKEGLYYIYEEVKTGRIRICKNKDILEYEVSSEEARRVSLAELRDRYCVIGEIRTSPFDISFYGIENFKKQIKADAINALCRILGQ